MNRTHPRSVKPCSVSPNCHNLDVKMYKFQEILQLFELTSGNITEEDMKRCKHTVLMTHPDKSRLPPEYFLFYKKAFDIISEFYKSQTKTSQSVIFENAQYTTLNPNNWDKNTHRKIGENIQKMDKDEFNQKFNHLFDQNMDKPPDTEKNNWFKSTESQYEIPQDKNINRAFEHMKGQTAGLVAYRGVQNMNSSTRVAAGNLYDDDDDENGADANGSTQYISSDPFSKLKYDDLRKVHKDQSVLSVGERDYAKMRKYSNIEQLHQERNTGDMNPLDKGHAEEMMKSQERQMVEEMMKKEYNAKLRSMEYAEKNKSVLASFLYIGR